jgi:hypothetical protein
MDKAINFYSIEEPGGSRGHWPGWTTEGRELERRPRGLLFTSEYHRLIAKERRQPWKALALVCLLLAAAWAILCVAAR